MYKKLRILLLQGALTLALLISGCKAITEPALFSACSEGNLTKVQYLVQSGVNVNAKDTGFSRAGETPLMYAANRGHIEVMKYLISKGADVNAISKGGESSVGRAALTRQLEAIKLLIASGAVLEKENNGLILTAATNGDLELLKFLISQGVSLNIVNANGDTALHHTIQFNAPISVIELLLKSGMKADEKNKFGETPLMMAEKYRRQDALAAMTKSLLVK